MKITFHEYNSFIIEHDGKTVAIDPGATFFYRMRFQTLIPKEVWPEITHIFVTHCDPDHYWFADKVAESSGAPVILDSRLISGGNRGRALGPRSKGLKFTWEIPHPVPIEFGATQSVDGISVTTIKATHGPLTVKIGAFSRTETPGPNERIGWNGVGFVMSWGERVVVNMGDTLLERDAWKDIRKPDVLMLPIGGDTVGNTMGVEDALKVVEMIQPALVIPTHYNLRAFFTDNFCPADPEAFRHGVERLGITCATLNRGESVDLS